uniref:Uncharacterized protein n=1 Tax=Anguilla anguilla TaxID=7936 RepID=A0A0E9W594_ANGAN
MRKENSQDHSSFIWPFGCIPERGEPFNLTC